MNEQILIQHALKYLAECEYDQREPTPVAFAEKLALSEGQFEQLLRDLRAADLVQGDIIALTPAGREFALHVLQAHRLYETYLARKTGLPESAWHKLADEREHDLSESDVKRLADELGHPLFDPHGDPIPTGAGEMPAKRGRPILECPAGFTGRVVHIEDEPPRLYAHIAKAGFAPGTVIRIERKNAGALVIRAEGRTFDFPNEVAAQISAVDLGENETYDESVERLSSLHPGESACVVGLSPLCRGLERNRLLDLGVVPGADIAMEFANPSGSPIAYRIRGACIAFRREQAEHIRIRKART